MSTPYSQPAAPLSPADEKTWSVLAHIGGVFFGWVAPLLGYLLLKDRGPFVRHHTVAALNFQLTLLIPVIAGLATSFLGFGLVILVFTWAAGVVGMLFAAKATNEGQYFRYPFAIDFVR